MLQLIIQIAGIMKNIVNRSFIRVIKHVDRDTRSNTVNRTNRVKRILLFLDHLSKGKIHCVCRCRNL